MKRVIVIGGGFAGSTIAEKLQNRFNVTIIDDKPYFEFTPGVLRTIAHPTRGRGIQVQHKDYLKNVKIFLGKVNKINSDSVIVNGKKIDYDYLVLATGSSYKAPFKHPQLFSASRSKELAVYNRHIIDGKEILIIGGGLVGVELAGEIGHYYHGKKVTIVSSTDHLLDRMPVKAQEYAKKVLQEMGVDIVFNELVTQMKSKYFTTKSGKKMKGDIGFTCVGTTPNTSFLDSKLLSERGFVKVDSRLQVQGFSNVFAGGDITDIKEEKTAQNAERHAQVICENIMRLENGDKLVDYKKKKSPLVISIGPVKGILVWNNFVLTGFIPAILKWLVEKKEMWKKRN